MGEKAEERKTRKRGSVSFEVLVRRAANLRSHPPSSPSLSGLAKMHDPGDIFVADCAMGTRVVRRLVHSEDCQLWMISQT